MASSDLELKLVTNSTPLAAAIAVRLMFFMVKPLPLLTVLK
jgi:hypothetical protein